MKNIFALFLFLLWPQQGQAQKALYPDACPAIAALWQEPNWQPLVLERHAEGDIAQILFLEPVAIKSGQEVAIKRRPVLLAFLSKEGQLQAQSDVVGEEIDSPPLTLLTSAPAFVLHGKATVEGPGSELRHLQFKEGKLHGSQEIYYRAEETAEKKGPLKQKLSYEAGTVCGTVYSYYPNGQLFSEQPFVGGQREGIGCFYSPQGKKIAQRSYRQGLPHGTWLEWDKEGRLRSQKNYRRGRLHDSPQAAALLAFEEGKLCQEKHFFCGLPHGVCQTWYLSRQLQNKACYRRGQKVGQEVYFEEKGALLAQLNWQDKGKKLAFDMKSGTKIEASASEKGQLVGKIQEWQGSALLATYFKDKDGLLEGDFLRWYSDGALQAQLFYKKGKLCGLQRQYHPNGQLQIEAHYTKGLVDGTYKEWSDKEELLYSASASLGQKEGHCQEKYRDGTPKSTCSYRHGQLSGPFLQWTSNHVLQEEGRYEEGLKEGLFCRWSKEGQLQESAFFVKGKLEGLRKVWQPASFLQAHYREGLLEGPFLLCDSLGAPIQLWNYEGGQLEGEGIEYYILKTQGQPGPLRARFTFAKGLLEGDFATFYEEGSPQLQGSCTQGQLQGFYRLLSKSGELLKEGCYEKGWAHGPFWQRYSDGSSLKSTYHKGLLHGDYLLYFPREGQDPILALSAHYKMGQLEGLQRWFWPGGALRKSAFYVEGKLHGEVVLYSEEGSVIESLTYRAGKKENR